MISALSQMWLPEVRQSRPQSKNSSARSGVTPKPSAAFSTLATEKSTCRSATSEGKRERRICRPALPLMSPMRTMRMRGHSCRRARPLPGVVHGTCLPDDADADGAGVLDLLLDAGGDVLRQPDRVAVGGRPGLDDHPHLLAGTHRVRLADAAEGSGDLLQMDEAL